MAKKVTTKSTLKSGKIDYLALYRIRPEGQPKPLILGGKIKLSKKLSEIFGPTFDGTDKKLGKHQPFHFVLGDQRQNAVRTDLVALINKPKQRPALSLKLAEKLQRLIDERVKDLLLIVSVGKIGAEHRIVIWIYPSDSPIKFSNSRSGPTVQEVQDAFSRSSKLRKAVYFDAPARVGRNDMLRGNVVDSSTGQKGKTWATYWVEDFLEGTIELRPQQGTAVMVKALQAAQGSAHTDQERSSVYAAFHGLMSGSVSTTSLVKFGNTLQGAARAAYIKNLPKTIERDANFAIDSAVISKNVKSLVFILKNGVSVIFPPNSSVDPNDFISTVDGTQIMTVSGEIAGRKYES